MEAELKHVLTQITPVTDVEDRLTELLNRVIDWLKFAETKNSGAVGLSSTALGVIVTFLVAGPPVPIIAGVGLAVGAVTLMVSLLFSVASFFPQTNLEKNLSANRKEQPGPQDNLLFYGHLARYEPYALAFAVAEHYFERFGDECLPSRYAVDLASQVVTNSRITVRKLTLYRNAMLLFTFGVLIASAAMAFAAFVI